MNSAAEIVGFLAGLWIPCVLGVLGYRAWLKHRLRVRTEIMLELMRRANQARRRTGWMSEPDPPKTR